MVLLVISGWYIQTPALISSDRVSCQTWCLWEKVFLGKRGCWACNVITVACPPGQGGTILSQPQDWVKLETAFLLLTRNLTAPDGIICWQGWSCCESGQRCEHPAFVQLLPWWQQELECMSVRTRLLLPRLNLLSCGHSCSVLLFAPFSAALINIYSFEGKPERRGNTWVR